MLYRKSIYIKPHGWLSRCNFQGGGVDAILLQGQANTAKIVVKVAKTSKFDAQLKLRAFDLLII